MHPLLLRRQADFSSGRGKSTAAVSLASSAGMIAFSSTALLAGTHFPSVPLRNMQIYRRAQSVEELPDPHPVNSSCSSSTSLWCLYHKLYRHNVDTRFRLQQHCSFLDLLSFNLCGSSNFQCNYPIYVDHSLYASMLMDYPQTKRYIVL